MNTISQPLKSIRPFYEMEKECLSYGLDGTDIFYTLTTNEKVKSWNGIGPSKFPKWLRSLISSINQNVECACYIHDLEYYIGGSKSDFHASNSRLLCNSLKILKCKRPELSLPCYLFAKLKAYIAYKACDYFGFKSWKFQ